MCARIQDQRQPTPQVSRRFVLEPLAEIAPDFIDPVTNQPVVSLLNALPPGPKVERWQKENLAAEDGANRSALR